MDSSIVILTTMSTLLMEIGRDWTKSSMTVQQEVPPLDLQDLLMMDPRNYHQSPSQKCQQQYQQHQQHHLQQHQEMFGSEHAFAEESLMMKLTILITPSAAETQDNRGMKK